MTSDWNFLPFGELLSEPTRNGIYKSKEFQGLGTPVIKMGEVYQNREINPIKRDLLDLNRSEIEKFAVLEGDLLFCRTSLVMEGVGHCAIVKKLDETTTYASNLIRARVNPSKAFPNFYRYYFSSPQGIEQLLSIARGTSVATITGPDIARLHVPFPDLTAQRAIAGILASLDDKIQINRHMNRTLVLIARALFKEILKKIKKQGSILAFANLLSGGTPSTSEESYWNGDIEWVSAKDVGNVDEVFLLDTEKKITQAGVDNSATKLLPAKTVIVTARGTVGAYCILGKPMSMNQTNYGLKAKSGVGDYFVYFTLAEMVEQLKQQSYGTIFDTITTRTFQEALCAHPPESVMRDFEERVTPLMEAALNNQKESRTLATLRDALLPKMMKGEVRADAA